MEARDKTRITVAEMTTQKELKTEPILDRTSKYTDNWIQRVGNAKGQLPQNSKILQTEGTKEPRTTLK